MCITTWNLNSLVPEDLITIIKVAMALSSTSYTYPIRIAMSVYYKVLVVPGGNACGVS